MESTVATSPDDSAVGAGCDSIVLRLLTYNVYMRPPGIAANCGDQKDLRLREVAARVLPGYDVVVLQEMFGSMSSRRGRLCAAARAQGYHTPPRELAGPPRGLLSGHLVDGGLLTLSRWTVGQSRSVTYKRGVRSDRVAAKGATYARLCDPSGRRHAHVFNTHLQASYSVSPDDESEAAVRASQFSQLAEFICASVADDSNAGTAAAPILVAGDLNVVAGSLEHGYLVAALSCGGRYEPRDVLAEHLTAADTGVPGTSSQCSTVVDTYRVPPRRSLDSGTHCDWNTLHRLSLGKWSVVPSAANERLDYVFMLLPCIPSKRNSSNSKRDALHEAAAGDCYEAPDDGGGSPSSSSSKAPETEYNQKDDQPPRVLSARINHFESENSCFPQLSDHSAIEVILQL